VRVLSEGYDQALAGCVMRGRGALLVLSQGVQDISAIREIGAAGLQSRGKLCC